MLWKKITFHNYYLVSIILGVASCIGIFFLKNFLPPILPIFYGKPYGIEQLASTMFLLVIPGASILVSVINILLSTLTRDEFIKKFLAVGSLVFSLMTTITMVKIILLVGFF